MFDVLLETLFLNVVALSLQFKLNLFKVLLFSDTLLVSLLLLNVFLIFLGVNVKSGLNTNTSNF